MKYATLTVPYSGNQQELHEQLLWFISAAFIQMVLNLTYFKALHFFNKSLEFKHLFYFEIITTVLVGS